MSQGCFQGRCVGSTRMHFVLKKSTLAFGVPGDDPSGCYSKGTYTSSSKMNTILSSPLLGDRSSLTYIHHSSRGDPNPSSLQRRLMNRTCGCVNRFLVKLQSPQKLRTFPESSLLNAGNVIVVELHLAGKPRHLPECAVRRTTSETKSSSCKDRLQFVVILKSIGAAKNRYKPLFRVVLKHSSCLTLPETIVSGPDKQSADCACV